MGRFDQMGQLAWYMRGGGRELYLEYYQKMLKADVMPFLYAPDGPECFGWFKKPVTSVADFTKLRFRMSSGLPSDCSRRAVWSSARGRRGEFGGMAE